MKTGKDLYDIAIKHKGAKYVFGIVVPKDNANWTGAFDCAEFISYVIYQATGKLFGCASNKSKPAQADAWTNFFKRDIDAGLLISIPVEQGIRTKGAILLRYTVGTNVGHIVMSDGTGETIEANSTKYGTGIFKATGRRWDVAFLVPGVDYTESAPVANTQPVVYRVTKPIMQDPKIKQLQVALTAKGFDTNGIDGKYGNDTMKAVKIYQLTEGLVPDGEVGTDTLKMLGIAC